MEFCFGRSKLLLKKMLWNESKGDRMWLVGSFIWRKKDPRNQSGRNVLASATTTEKKGGRL